MKADALNCFRKLRGTPERAGQSKRALVESRIGRRAVEVTCDRNRRGWIELDFRGAACISILIVPVHAASDINSIQCERKSRFAPVTSCSSNVFAKRRETSSLPSGFEVWRTGA